MSTTLKMTIDLSPLQKLAQQSPEHFKKAMERGAIQFLNWANNGSKNTSKKPPIRFGVLRGSSSVFVGNELVRVYPQTVRAGADEQPTPARSHSAPSTTMTSVWNTDYAAKMHEWRGNWGPFTVQDGDAGAKWLEEHLEADKEDLMAVIGEEFKKEAGL